MEENNGLNEDAIEKHFKALLEEGLGVDLKDANFTDTPRRVAKSYKEIFKGMSSTKEDLESVFKKCFPSDYEGIVLEKDITVFSMCPHHFLPIRYEVAVGYIPGGCTVGLSKLSRIVEILAKKPALQEDFTKEIVDQINEHIHPKGVICVVKGAHYCMRMRGIKQKDVWTTTSEVSGFFLSDKQLELKFYELLKN